MNIVRAIGHKRLSIISTELLGYFRNEKCGRAAQLPCRLKRGIKMKMIKKKKREKKKWGEKNIGDGRRDEAPAKRRTSMSTEERKRLCGSGSNCGNCSTTFPFVRAYTAALTDINIQI